MSVRPCCRMKPEMLAALDAETQRDVAAEKLLLPPVGNEDAARDQASAHDRGYISLGSNGLGAGQQPTTSAAGTLAGQLLPRVHADKRCHHRQQPVCFVAQCGVPVL